MSAPVVRVSILRCRAEDFAMFKEMMDAAATVLLPGITAIPGCLAYFAGADEITSSLSNVSVWRSLDDARQMDRFQPMLDLARQFVEKGVTFERPIMNYGILWQLGTAVR